MQPLDRGPNGTSAAGAAPASARLHERLLAALLQTREPKVGEVVLLSHATNFALLILPSSALRIYLFAADERTDLAALASVLDSFVTRNDSPGSRTYFVVSGGSEAVSAVLKEAVPRRASSILGFYQLLESGEFVHIGREKLPLLERCAARASTTPPLAAAEIEAALAQGQALAQREHEVITKLRGRYRTTLALTLACVSLMGLSYLWGSGSWDLALYCLGANSADAVRRGEVWRLLASAFLHGNLLHLGLNMYGLWSFGTLLEALLGQKRFLILYTLSALGGSLCSAFLGMPGISVGASGAIWGLMAGGYGLSLRPNGILPSSLVVQLRSRLFVPLVINALFSFSPGIDFRAHLGGGVVGFLLVTLVLTHGVKPVERRKDVTDVEAAGSALTLFGALLALTALLLSVAAGVVVGRSLC